MSETKIKQVLQDKGEPNKQYQRLPENNLRHALVLIVLDIFITPKLRELVDQKLKVLYEELVRKHHINTEQNDLYKFGKFCPNYGSLIDNQNYPEEHSYPNGVKTCNWKYTVNNHFELARLFLEPKMAWYHYTYKQNLNNS
jgi:hypothetical protein